MSAHNRIYWICQIIGWGSLVAGNVVTSFLTESLVTEVYLAGIAMFSLGILITHLFRKIALSLEWTKMAVLPLIPRVVISPFIMGAMYTLVYGLVSDLSFPNSEKILVSDFGNLLIDVINFSVVFFIWTLIYFAIHIFENFRASQIKNLELKAANTEIELSSFKNQMNPHFMFNSLNSIRALIDEDPIKAKGAVTELSGLLRNTLTLGKKQLVTLREELELVEHYLAMEKIRYEERLNVQYMVPEDLLDFVIPPFMMQTIVENAIKHGISKLKEGGTVALQARQDEGQLIVVVENTGQIRKSEESSGIGLSNTRKRLELLFSDRASLQLKDINGKVVATLAIPLLKENEYESIDN
ncbi:MAG: two-component system LytT family sensor kinase [Flavobacteriales bacterium]|jgi:two-component system LytT family sensor kinase